MTFDWQNIAAIALVVVASIYTVRWVCRSISSNSGCGECTTQSDAQPTAKQIVSVEDLARSGRGEQ